MAWHVILCSIAYIDVPNKESNKHASGRVVIYISVHLVSIYTLTFSNVLLVLALNPIVHKSSYCKCSLAWCQARTFLLFTTWTHPLQMREYPLQYASTDKNKKSHYKMVVNSRRDFLCPWPRLIWSKSMPNVYAFHFIWSTCWSYYRPIQGHLPNRPYMSMCFTTICYGYKPTNEIAGYDLNSSLLQFIG